MTEMHIEQLNSLVPGWLTSEAHSTFRTLELVLDRLRWRPIAEMRQDDGHCLVVNIGDPCRFWLASRYDADYIGNRVAYCWTHFQRIHLGNGEAKLLLSEAL